VEKRSSGGMRYFFEKCSDTPTGERKSHELSFGLKLKNGIQNEAKTFWTLSVLKSSQIGSFSTLNVLKSDSSSMSFVTQVWMMKLFTDKWNWQSLIPRM